MCVRVTDAHEHPLRLHHLTYSSVTVIPSYLTPTHALRLLVVCVCDGLHPLASMGYEYESQLLLQACTAHTRMNNHNQTNAQVAPLTHCDVQGL